MLCFPTQIKVGTRCVKDHQVLRLEHRLGLMEILKNLKRNIFVFKKLKKNEFFFFKYLYSRPFNFANSGHSRILMGLQYVQTDAIHTTGVEPETL